MKKGSPLALLPILVFLLVFIGSGIVFHDFYAMPAVVGFLIALVVAFLQNLKRTFAQKLVDVTRNMGEDGYHRGFVLGGSSFWGYVWR